MSLPDSVRLLAALDATWPALRMEDRDGWRLRVGAGGGKRVSAASALNDSADIARAEAAQRDLGQRPLFRLSAKDVALDAQLAGRGYVLRDPSLLYVARSIELARKPAPIRLFDLWPPLAIMRELWAEGGIGPARLAVMARAHPPRTGFVARIEDRAAGVAFAALDDRIAMIHAIEVTPRARRKGVARMMIEGAADWARAQGADWVALAVTEANRPARALYESLGMQIAGRYHYRIAAEDSAAQVQAPD